MAKHCDIPGRIGQDGGWLIEFHFSFGGGTRYGTVVTSVAFVVWLRMPPSLFLHLGKLWVSVSSRLLDLRLKTWDRERALHLRLSPLLILILFFFYFNVFFFCCFPRFVYTIFWCGPCACGLLGNPEKSYYSYINNAISWGPTESRQKQKVEKLKKKSKLFLHSLHTYTHTHQTSHLFCCPNTRILEYSAFNRALHSIWLPAEAAAKSTVVTCDTCETRRGGPFYGEGEGVAFVIGGLGTVGGQIWYVTQFKIYNIHIYPN